MAKKKAKKKAGMTEEEVLEIIEEAARDGRTQLDLSFRGIRTLPVEIGKLTRLTTLWASNGRLTSVPPELWKLTNLTKLTLHGNYLKSVPVGLAKLKNLTTLTLHGNRFWSVPSELGQLINLTKLNLGNNPLMSVPSELGKLSNLVTLTLDNSLLMTVPAELGKLAKLTWLLLGRNQLTSLPAELGKLTKLTALLLENNELRSLPVELGRLTNLKTLQIAGNPLESPLGEVVKQGTEAVLAYLRELEKGAKKRYEAKLLLLGDGGEGKTCVSRALRGLKFKEQVRTAGVEVKAWVFENAKYRGEKDKEITLNIWDFEGQEINHQSHQFFLTDESLYVLVINGRREFKMKRAEYWLDTIRSRAPESRVILVASECEETTPSWPLDKLKANYGDLLKGEKWYFAVGCKDGKGIEDLSNEIKGAAAGMDVMGQEWPVTYEKAEDAIRTRAKKDAQVRRGELYGIFEESGISKDGFENVAERMATLGVITQFKDSPELRDFVVLNPQWLTKGISLVMEDEQLEKDKGEITHERMSEIWEKDYKGMYPVFHSCMKEFELCYDMEEAAGSLVPLRFGSAVPEIPWSEIAGAKERRVEYKLNIRPPKGIMSRFIVKTHYMIAKTGAMSKGVYWLNGVFLQTGEGENTSEALCEFDNENKVLSIRVRAAFPQNMMEQLHGFARAVFSFFEGLKPERSYGCMKFEEAREDECEGAHKERSILFALSRDKKVDCETGWHEVDPKRLVYGFSSFGEAAVTLKELQAELAKKPKWAEGLIEDIESSLVWIDKTYDEVIGVRDRQEALSPQMSQRAALWMRNYIGGIINEVMDNRDFNAAPGVVSIVPVDGSAFNPKNWVNKEYVLRPYCEWEGGVHKVDFSVKFKKARVWWEKTAPKLAFGVKVLSAGIKIACAGLPVGIDPKIFEEIKNEVAFMKELAGHLELDGGAESDISDEAGKYVEGLVARLVDAGTGEDEKRIVRMQLAELFGEIAPKNYKARQWGELRRVRMPDNTYRWLCEKHRG